MSTLIQNKRDLDDFVKYNSKFLSDNFIFLAQKYYIEFILKKSCIEFSSLLEQQLNLLISQILKHPNIGNKISYLFQQRFKEFEEKIVNKSPTYNMLGNNGISSNDNNYQKKLILMEEMVIVKVMEKLFMISRIVKCNQLKLRIFQI